MICFLQVIKASCTVGSNHTQQCNGDQIVLCDIGYYIVIDSFTGKTTECKTCPDDWFCDGIDQKQCQDVFGSVCKSGTITLCQNNGINNYLLIPGSILAIAVCQPCSFAHICDGTQLEKPCNASISCQNGIIQLCESGFQIGNDKITCVQCGNLQICDGRTSTSCSDVPNIFNSTSCSNGQVVRCQLGYKLSTNKLNCFACSLSMICDGANETQCNIVPNAVSCNNGFLAKCVPGLYVDGSVCRQCQSANVCDGISEKPCSVVQDALNCTNGLVSRCKSGMVPSVEGDACQKCSVDLFCDGENQVLCVIRSNALICQEGLITECVAGYYVHNTGIQCVPCDTVGQLCNGVQMVSCPPFAVCELGVVENCTIGKFVSDDQLSCSECPPSSFCNGIGVFICSSMSHATSCLNGLILSCENGFIPAENKFSCESCPVGMICDGILAKCAPGLLVDENLNCVGCPVGKVCNGLVASDCQDKQVPSGDQSQCIADPGAGQKKMSIGAIVGIIVGIVSVCFIVGLVFYIRNQTKKKLQAQQDAILDQITKTAKPLKKGEVAKSVVIPTDDSVRTFQTGGRMSEPFLAVGNPSANPLRQTKEIEIVNGQQRLTESEESKESSELEEVAKPFVVKDKQYIRSDDVVKFIPAPVNLKQPNKDAQKLPAIMGKQATDKKIDDKKAKKPEKAKSTKQSKSVSTAKGKKAPEKIALKKVSQPGTVSVVKQEKTKKSESRGLSTGAKKKTKSVARKPGAPVKTKSKV